MGTNAPTAGFLVIDKPSGATSFSMVALVRRLTRVRRVGHAGTLDPLATGVLPVAFGVATRLVQYLDDGPKAYSAVVRFGSATDTFDAEGNVTQTGDPSLVTRDALERALSSFEGEVEQRPPAFSAIKLAGKPLYRYARAGSPVEPPLRRVRIESIDLVQFDDGVARIDVRCWPGTYIRSLAHDLGARLGCPAHLAALRRTESGGFRLSDARTPDELRALAQADALADAMLAPDRAVERRPAALLGDARTAEVLHGRDLALAADGGPGERLCRAYSTDGRFLGMLERTADARWHPRNVLGGA